MGCVGLREGGDTDIGDGMVRWIGREGTHEGARSFDSGSELCGDNGAGLREPRVRVLQDVGGGGARAAAAEGTVAARVRGDRGGTAVQAIPGRGRAR